MFTKELSTHLNKILEERKLTVESVATAAGMTREQLTNIKNGKSVAKLSSLEKICTALELNPNDLLLNEKSLQKKNLISKQVDIMYSPEKGSNIFIPVCPNCNALLHSEWESYCSNCGQRLNWERYVNSKVTYKRPEIIKDLRD